MSSAITGRCNFRCRHCLLSSPQIKSDHLSFKEIQEIIGQLEEAGIYKIIHTGGEPLIRPDFLDIVDELTRYHIGIKAIYTNGALVNENLLNALIKRKIHPVFFISFDGLGWHDWLRGIPKAEEMAKNAFLLCKERGFETQAEFCLHRMNQSVLAEMIQALASWGCRAVKIAPIEEMGEWKNQDQTLSLDEAEIYRCYLDLIEKEEWKHWPITIELEDLVVLDAKTNQSLFLYAQNETAHCQIPLCESARNTMYLSFAGDLLPCMMLAGLSIEKEFFQGKNETISQALNDSFYLDFISLSFEDFLQANPDCQDCSYQKLCLGGCRASALRENEKAILGKDQSRCRFFKEGWCKRFQKALLPKKPV